METLGQGDAARLAVLIEKGIEDKSVKSGAKCVQCINVNLLRLHSSTNMNGVRGCLLCTCVLCEVE
jgi:hypothetical protein